jgi:hypothetical protein
MDEELLLYRGIQKINETYGFQCEVLDKEFLIGKRRVDARILIRKGSYQQRFNVEVKTVIVPAQIPKLKDTLQDLVPYMLIAGYITTQAKEILRYEKIPYLDAAGNFYLDWEGMFILIENHTTSRISLKSNHDAFQKAGLKVIYQFLIHPDYLNKPYRFIAEHATVTIDTVGRVIHGLLADKYIVQSKDKEYRFSDRTKLFQDWVTAFNKELRPKLKQNKYQWLDKNQTWRNIELPNGTHWGGAVAGEQLSNYLIADQAVVYTKLPFQEVMKKLRMVPNANGTVTVLEKFWKDDEEQSIVHPILVYADLVNDTNPRYIETANKIYKDYVEDKL